MSDDEEDDFYLGRLVCESCGESSFIRVVEDEDDEENEESEDMNDEQKLDRLFADQCNAMCISCGEEVENKDFPWRKKYEKFKVGLIDSAEAFKSGSKQYMLVAVDVGLEDTVQVITAGKVKAGQRVVVALEGAIVPAGAGQEDEHVVVKKSSCGGRASFGMLCDSPALSWTGGGKGTAVSLPDSFDIGSTPPHRKPRSN